MQGEATRPIVIDKYVIINLFFLFNLIIDKIITNNNLNS
jgi:hypothetical protein